LGHVLVDGDRPLLGLVAHDTRGRGTARAAVVLAAAAAEQARLARRRGDDQGSQRQRNPHPAFHGRTSLKRAATGFGQHTSPSTLLTIAGTKRGNLEKIHKLKRLWQEGSLRNSDFHHFRSNRAKISADNGLSLYA